MFYMILFIQKNTREWTIFTIGKVCNEFIHPTGIASNLGTWHNKPAEVQVSIAIGAIFDKLQSMQCKCCNCVHMMCLQREDELGHAIASCCS